MKGSKIFFLILCTALLSAATALGTLAYLTSRDSVANTFTVDKVSIKLDETMTDSDGKTVYDEDACPIDGCTEDQILRTETGNKYHIVPGKTYLKDPTVTVKANSENAYVRMILIVHNAPAVQAIIDADETLVDYSSLFSGWNPEIWLYEGFQVNEDAKTISFEFRYKEIVSGANEDVKLTPLFTELTVPGSVTHEQLEKLNEGNFQIVVEGHAIQAVTFADADAAWKAFDAQQTSVQH